MIAIALTSIAAGIFDVKHYLHLQLVPHITKDHQVSEHGVTLEYLMLTMSAIIKHSIGVSLRIT